MKEENFKKFGEEFEKRLVYALVVDSAFADTMREILDFKYFRKDHTKELAKQIYAHKNTYHQHPGLTTVRMFPGEAFDDHPDALKTSVINLIHEFEVYENDRIDLTYVKEKSRHFCKERHAINAIMMAYQNVVENKSERVDYEKAIFDLQDSLKAGEKREKGYDYKVDFDARFEHRARFPITTGWNRLNLLMGGGLGSGELGCVIASSGSGKSFVLSALGAAALRDGRNVLHFTLELSREVVAQRYDANLCNIPLNELVEKKEEIREVVQDLDGNLIICHYPMRFATTETLRLKVQDLVHNHDFKPDLIIVDYAELLKPLTTHKERRQDVEGLFEELRALGQTFKVPVWTASQTNRGGLEKEVVQLNDIAEAYAKVFPCDFVMTLARTMADKNNNTGRFLVAKNRNGDDGVVLPLNIDWSRAFIQVTDAEYELPGGAPKPGKVKDNMLVALEKIKGSNTPK